MVKEVPRDSFFEQVWDKVSTVIEKLDENENQRLFLKSLLMGGTVTAEYAIVNCHGLSKYWSDGNESKAVGLTKLFFWMIFSYYQYHLKVDNNSSRIELITSKEAAHKLLTIFGNIDEGESNLYTNLDIQLNYDIEKSPHMIHVSCLLLAVAIEICGHKCLDWAKIHFPVREMFHIVNKGAILDSEPIREQHDINEMQVALATGMEAANLYYTKALNSQ